MIRLGDGDALEMHWKCISVTAVPDVRVEGMRERRYGGDEE
jgi:hypothetical protein